MFPAFRTARRKSSHFALAIALATGTAVAATAYAPASYAQEVPDPSSGFAEVYNQIVPLVQGETQDYAAAQDMIPTMTGAIENARDRDLAGTILINIGSNISDRQLQRRGIEMRLESGLVAPEQIGVMNWYAGNFAIEVEEYAQAREYLNRSMAAGYSEQGVDIINLIARTYTEEGNDRGAYEYLSSAIADAEAAGAPLREAWLRNSLQYTYEEGMVTEAAGLIQRLVRTTDDQERAWSDGLRIMSQILEVDEEDARVDLYRLMAERGALVDRPDLYEYIEAIDPRLMSNEVLDVLRIGVDAGVYGPGDEYYAEVSALAEARAPIDRNGIDGIVAEGRSGDALDAMNAGDVAFSLDNYALAEEMWGLGLERGFNPNTANMRVGVSQAMQGNFDAAMASFANVAGERAPIAALWTLHAEMLAQTPGM